MKTESVELPRYNELEIYIGHLQLIRRPSFLILFYDFFQIVLLKTSWLHILGDHVQLFLVAHTIPNLLLLIGNLYSQQQNPKK